MIQESKVGVGRKNCINFTLCHRSRMFFSMQIIIFPEFEAESSIFSQFCEYEYFLANYHRDMANNDKDKL